MKPKRELNHTHEPEEDYVTGGGGCIPLLILLLITALLTSCDNDANNLFQGIGITTVVILSLIGLFVIIGALLANSITIILLPLALALSSCADKPPMKTTTTKRMGLTGGAETVTTTEPVDDGFADALKTFFTH